MAAADSSPVSAPAGADYFSVFDLPRRLALDTKALERAFYKRSREVHPDRFAQATPQKQQWSLEQTSLLNDAYRSLKDPIARTEYLLRLEGVTLADDAATADKQGKKNVPPALLAEVFELNMQLEELRMGEDDPLLRSELEGARTRFEQQLAALGAEIEREWAAWDTSVESSAPDRQTLERMAAVLDKRRYLRNLVRDVREALGD